MAIGIISEKGWGDVEIDIDAKDLKLTLAVDIYEDEEATKPARRIIWGTETYYVKPHWTLTGKIVSQLSGTWRVKLDLESIGRTPDFTSVVQDVALDPHHAGEYSTIFKLQPADLHPHEAGTVYFPAVVLSTVDPLGGEGYIWGFFVGRPVMFIQKKKEL